MDSVEVGLVWDQRLGNPADNLPLIKRAADQGELPLRLYAMMLDRQLMNTG